MFDDEGRIFLFFTLQAISNKYNEIMNERKIERDGRIRQYGKNRR